MQLFKQGKQYTAGLSYTLTPHNYAVINRAHVAHPQITEENYSNVFVNLMFLDRAKDPASDLRDSTGPVSLEEGICSAIPKDMIQLSPTGKNNVRFTCKGYVEEFLFPLELDVQTEFTQYTRILSRKPGSWTM
jgi:hypothetical protein